ncbi:MAG: A/G-specific adenine glycosylase [bacterium]|nr:A/G-specific adenine glycosylase [bacterium]
MRRPGAITTAEARAFRRLVRGHYTARGRRLPWRRTRDPYRILVSEVMLQQTQVERVVRKYREFTAAFPDFRSLDRAPLREVLRVWSGLGYNRRALALKRIARRVVREHAGSLPSSPDLLAALPGIGPATAASIAAFAFGRPTVFVETNIRAAFIHRFFPRRNAVPDSEILPLVERTLDASDPRTWYSALMDYGAAVRRRHGNPQRRSARYRRQPPFEGSRRQLRGRIVRACLARRGRTGRGLARLLGEREERVRDCLEGLARDGLVTERRGRYAAG